MGCVIADGAHEGVGDGVIKTYEKKQATSQGGFDTEYRGHVKQREESHRVEQGAGCQGSASPSPAYTRPIWAAHGLARMAPPLPSRGQHRMAGLLQDVAERRTLRVVHS